MEIFVVLVMLVLPGPGAPKQELHREWITASSFTSCQLHAQKLVEAKKKEHAEIIEQQKAKVTGTCYSQGQMV